MGWELALAWQSVKMLVTPRPGVSMDNLIQDLQTSRDEAFNLRGGSSARTAQFYLLDYLDRAGRAARTLGNQISEADLASLVLNRRYELLLSSFGTMASPLLEAQRVVRDLVQLELDERSRTSMRPSRRFGSTRTAGTTLVTWWCWTPTSTSNT